jgi:transposase
MEKIRIKRKFDRQFKEDAVKLSLERNNMSAVARELDIDVKLIRRWKAEQDLFQGVSFQGSGTSRLTEEQKKIRQLEKDLHKQKLENEILKKALGIISSSDR